MNLKEKIRNVQDFPKKGIGFKDITTILKDKDAFRESITQLAEKLKDKKIDKIIGAEARGFIVGAALAYELGCGFIPVRKPGKLPSETISYTYTLEYGEDTLEMHRDAVSKGENILLVDDLMATGGTLEAMVHMVERLEGVVAGIAVWIELAFLNPRDKFKGIDIVSLVKYDSE